MTGGDDRRLRVHALGGGRALLETVGSVAVNSSVLCLDAAPCAAPDAAAPPRLASGGGSGGLLSDATVALWRLDSEDGGPVADGGAKKRQRQDEEEEEEDDDDDDGGGDDKGEKQPQPSADATAAQSSTPVDIHCLPCRC